MLPDPLTFQQFVFYLNKVVNFQKIDQGLLFSLHSWMHVVIKMTTSAPQQQCISSKWLLQDSDATHWQPSRSVPPAGCPSLLLGCVFTMLLGQNLWSSYPIVLLKLSIFTLWTPEVYAQMKQKHEFTLLPESTPPFSRILVDIKVHPPTWTEYFHVMGSVGLCAEDTKTWIYSTAWISSTIQQNRSRFQSSLFHLILMTLDFLHDPSICL